MADVREASRRDRGCWQVLAGDPQRECPEDPGPQQHTRHSNYDCFVNRWIPETSSGCAPLQDEVPDHVPNNDAERVNGDQPTSNLQVVSRVPTDRTDEKRWHEFCSLAALASRFASKARRIDGTVQKATLQNYPQILGFCVQFVGLLTVSSVSDKPPPRCLGNRGIAARGLEFALGVGDAILHRGVGKSEAVGDLHRIAPVGEVRQNFEFASREPLA